MKNIIEFQIFTEYLGRYCSKSKKNDKKRQSANPNNHAQIGSYTCRFQHSCINRLVYCPI